MTVLITDKKEINQIISEKIKGRKLIFTDYYKFGIMKKGIEYETVLQIFPQFDKVFEIEKETLKHGILDLNYFIKLATIDISLLQPALKIIKC